MGIFERTDPPAWKVEHYRGQRRLTVVATQTEPWIASPRERRLNLNEWIAFFADRPQRVRHLNLASRVPQDLLDSLSTQRQLQSLSLKWGPYSDLAPLSELTQLRELRLEGASGLVDLAPLKGLTNLHTLWVSGGRGITDYSPLGSLTSLRWLLLGDVYPGSNRRIPINDLSWIVSLTQLRRLQLPASRVRPEQLDFVASLPNLSSVELPHYRDIRKKVEELARSSAAFERQRRQTAAYDEWIADRR